MEDNNVSCMILPINIFTCLKLGRETWRENLEFPRQMIFHLIGSPGSNFKMHTIKAIYEIWVILNVPCLPKLPSLKKIFT